MIEKMINDTLWSKLKGPLRKELPRNPWLLLWGNEVTGGQSSGKLENAGTGSKMELAWSGV
jgi:hypothetical protein